MHLDLCSHGSDTITHGFVGKFDCGKGGYCDCNKFDLIHRCAVDLMMATIIDQQVVRICDILFCLAIMEVIYWHGAEVAKLLIDSLIALVITMWTAAYDFE